MIVEITAQELDAECFINGKVLEIKDAVGDGIAINALSGGVDSSTVTYNVVPKPPSTMEAV